MFGIERGRPGRAGDPIIVTGSSTGLGLETALHLAERGFRVFATVRNLASRPGRARRREGARRRARRAAARPGRPGEHRGGRDAVVAETGSVFGLVNNGGIGLRGAVEDSSEEEIGASSRRTCSAPSRSRGRCCRTCAQPAAAASSRSPRSAAGCPASACRSTARASSPRRGWPRALALELAPFGIQSIIVEPGIIKTPRWAEHRGTAEGARDESSPYYGLFWASEAIADRIVERSPTKPADVAAAVDDGADRRRTRACATSSAAGGVVIFLRRHLPQRLFERLYYGGQLRRLERNVDPALRPSQGGGTAVSRFLFTSGRSPATCSRRWRSPAHCASAATRSPSSAARPSARRSRARGSSCSRSSASTRSGRSAACAPIEAGGRQSAPVLRDWLVETIPDQVADLSRVARGVAARRDRHRPLDVGPDRRPARGRADPRRAVVDVHGPADPRARRARLGLRAAGAADGACPGAQRRDHPSHRIRRRAACGGAWTRSGPSTACGPLPEPVNALHRAAAALPGRERAELDYNRRDLPAERPLRRRLHLAPADAARDGGGAGGHPHRPAVGARRRQHARLGRAAPAARRRARASRDEPVEVIITTGRRARRRSSSASGRSRRTSTSRAGSTTASCCRAARRS